MTLSTDGEWDKSSEEEGEGIDELIDADNGDKDETTSHSKV